MKSHASANSLGIPAVMLGVLMVIAVPAALTRLAGWADLYGAVLVYLAFFEYIAVAAGLVRWGVGQLRS
ncbi:hypothetical protein [Nocardia sp. IFM 10818]